jgi:protein involved in polysaccharide export with SLBB domain
MNMFRIFLVLLTSHLLFAQVPTSALLSQFQQLEEVADSEKKSVDVSPSVVTAWSGPVDPATYMLGPGDELKIMFYNPERLTLDLQVDSDAQLTIPEYGRFPVDGISLAKLQSTYQGQWSELYDADSLAIWVSVPRTIRLQTGGLLLEAGNVELPYLTRLSALVDQMEFPEDTDVSLRRVLLIRDGTRQHVDIAYFRATGDLHFNPMLESGDQVVLQARGRFLRVRGPFALPADSVEYLPSDTPSHVAALLGGLLPGSKDGFYEVVRLATNGAYESFHFEEGDPQFQTLSFHAGDRMDYRWNQLDAFFAEVTIEGALLKPGVYPIEDGQTRVGDLVERLSLLDDADLRSLRIYREAAWDPELRYYELLDASTTMDPIELSYFKSRVTSTGGRVSALYDGSDHATQETLLRSGDRLFIPRESHDVEMVGAVKNQGRVLHRDGWTVKQYVLSVGGKSKGARMDLVRVRSPWSDQFVRVKSSYQPVPGDVVFIPYEESRSTYEWFKEGLGIAVQVLTVVLIGRGL